MTARGVAGLVVAVSIAGCVRGPNYQRPVVETPAAFRGGESEPAVSLAETSWPDLFDDPLLTRLGSRALEANHDLRIAAERVLQARERYGIAGSELFPTIDLDAGFAAARNSRVGAFGFAPGNTDASYTQAGFRLGWEVDVWGRLRSLEESALAAYIPTEEAGRGVRTTLLADIASAYLTLRALDRELEIAVETRDAAEGSLRLTELRKELGVGTTLDVRQAEQFYRSAMARIAASEREIALAENALNVLVGDMPGAVERGQSISELTGPLEVPAGLPSALLARRPDIREAEQSLIAANADIGVARAQLFPLISLTGFMGAQTTALTDLLTGQARQASMNPLASLPIFNRGRLRSQVRLSEANEREAVARYEQTILEAFREVADALAQHSRTREELREQGLLVQALRESRRLALLRYESGVDNFLQVLDADRSLFASEMVEVRLRRNVLLSVVELYRALGGGWE